MRERSREWIQESQPKTISDGGFLVVEDLVAFGWVARTRKLACVLPPNIMVDRVHEFGGHSDCPNKFNRYRVVYISASHGQKFQAEWCGIEIYSVLGSGVAVIVSKRQDAPVNGGFKIITDGRKPEAIAQQFEEARMRTS